MEDTSNIIEQLESGEYQRGQIETFKDWVNRHHAETMGNQKNFEIERVLAEMADFDNGPQYLHGYMPGDGNLRERVLRLSEETKQGSTGTPEKLEAYSQVLRDAALVIKKDAGWEIEPFDLGVALRFRFCKSPNWRKAGRFFEKGFGEGKRHFRLNVDLAGRCWMEVGRVIWRFWRFTLFRPDVEVHEVPESAEDVWLFSMGVAIK